MRYDTIGYVNEYLIWAAARSPLLCHQLMWNMQTNRFSDEDGKIKDAEIGDKIDKLLAKIKENFSEADKAFYDRQFKFSNDLTEISHLIKEKNKENGDRKRACVAEVQKIKVPPRVYLPSNPGCLVLDIDRKMGIPLQSAAKAPYLAQFKVKDHITQIFSRGQITRKNEFFRILDIFKILSRALLRNLNFGFFCHGVKLPIKNFPTVSNYQLKIFPRCQITN